MFHNLCDFIRDELKELDRKVASGGTMTMQELEYADKLSHIKKSLLTIDAMENPESYGYYDSDYSRGGNYSRSNRGRYMDRDRYSSRMMYRDGASMKDEIYDLMNKAPNEHVRRKLEEIVSEMNN